MPRPRNERPISVELTPGTDGRWHGFVTIGTKPDGSPDRVHRTAVMCPGCRAAAKADRECACAKRCEAKIRAVEDAVAADETPTAARDPWADRYFTEWLDSRRGEIEYGTLKSYSTVVRRYLVPNVKGMRLRQFNAAKPIRDLLRHVKTTVSAQAARKTLRVLRVALGHAERDRLVPRNEATYVPMPTLDTIEEVLPLTRDEAIAILPVIRSRRLAARWLLGLVHGLRQGEALGLMWTRLADPRIPTDVDLVTGEFTVREKLQRRTWEHGCADPHACGGTPRPVPANPDRLLPALHKVEPCRPGCSRHNPKRGCPPPCAKDCTRHASACPQRRGGGLVKGTPKGKKSRTAVLEPMVLTAFREWKVQQDEERRRAGSRWVETGHVFTTEIGAPIDPKRDWDEFQAILAEAGLAPARVHALRHTTATFLLAAGVQKRVVMELLGWSQDMTHVYQHPTDAMKRDATAAVGALLWQQAPQAPEPGSATALLPPAGGKVLQFRRKAV